MKKVNLGPGVVNYPMPVALVGAHVNGKANFIAVAWLSMVSYNPPKIGINLGQAHYTNQGIKENRVFTVCFPSAKHVKVTDYCGLVSGKSEDKSRLFKLFYGQSPNGPMIEEFPLNVECRLEKVIQNGANEMFVGDIVGIYADEDILVNGKVDLEKLNPILLGQTSTEYREIGKKIGQAWKIGKE